MKAYQKFILESDIEKGDILDISSDLKEIMLFCRKYGEKFDADELINTIQEKVGQEGTILIRTWNWDFCHRIPFDYKRTPSRVGALGNVALKRKDFQRTEHAIYSFAVWGKYQQEMIQMKNISAWGSDSPFGFLTKHHGKQFMLGSDMYNSLTYVHYVEEQTGVPYRYLKEFNGKYITGDGRVEERVYSMNVRKIDLNVRMFNRETAVYFPETFEEFFLEQGILNRKIYDNVFVGLVDLEKAFPVIQDDIINNQSRKICLYDGQ